MPYRTRHACGFVDLTSCAYAPLWVGNLDRHSHITTAGLAGTPSQITRCRYMTLPATCETLDVQTCQCHRRDDLHGRPPAIWIECMTCHDGVKAISIMPTLPFGWQACYDRFVSIPFGPCMSQPHLRNATRRIHSGIWAAGTATAEA
jgi:hypothetical protein